MNEVLQYQTPAMPTLFPNARDRWLETKRAANTEFIGKLTNRSEAEGLSHRTVVVVDDDPTVAVTLAEILAKHKIDAVWFTHPADALSFIKTAKVDLLLSDIHMPQMDGIALSERVHTIQPACSLFLFSAAANEPSILKRIESSPLPIYLEAKPLHPVRLVQTVQSFLPVDVVAVK